MASRLVNIDESAALAAHQFGNMTSQENEHVLGLDGVAIIVNPHNTVPFLTRAPHRLVLLERHLSPE